MKHLFLITILCVMTSCSKTEFANTPDRAGISAEAKEKKPQPNDDQVDGTDDEEDNTPQDSGDTLFDDGGSKDTDDDSLDGTGGDDGTDSSLGGDSDGGEGDDDGTDIDIDDGQTGGDLPARSFEHVSFSNEKMAQNGGQPGTGKMVFAIKNMREDDTNVTISAEVHSTDFDDHQVTVSSKENAENPALLDYTLEITFSYKFTGKLVRYDNQKFQASWENNGESASDSLTFSLFTFPEGIDPNGTPDAIVSGTAGYVE